MTLVKGCVANQTINNCLRSGRKSITREFIESLNYISSRYLRAIDSEEAALLMLLTLRAKNQISLSHKNHWSVGRTFPVI